MAIEVGATAPDFTLETQNSQQWTLSKHAGKNVVLLWYPLDWSAVCTNENCHFTSDFAKFDAANAVVVGISRDSIWSHKAFKTQNNISYDLLADPKLEATKLYGLEHPNGFMSHRATVIVGKDGKVAWVQVQENTGEIRDYAAVEAALNGLG